MRRSGHTQLPFSFVVLSRGELWMICPGLCVTVYKHAVDYRESGHRRVGDPAISSKIDDLVSRSAAGARAHEVLVSPSNCGAAAD